MKDTDLIKLLSKGFRLYSINRSLCVIRELKLDLTWKVLKPRRRSVNKLEADYIKILLDPMAIGIKERQYERTKRSNKHCAATIAART